MNNNIPRFTGAGLCPVLINEIQDSVRILSSNLIKDFFVLMTDGIST